MVKYVFFDIDDTLFPSSEFAELARRNAIKAMMTLGILQPEQTLEAKLAKIIEQKGSNYPYLFDELCEQFRIKKQARYVAAAVAAYHNTKSSISPYPEVQRILLQLREQGYHLYVASDGDAVKQWDKLIRLGLALYFDDVFVSGEMSIKKSKAFFQKMFHMLKIRPRDSVMIGDREDKDIVTAKAVGMTTVRVKRGKYAHTSSKADYIVSDLSELPLILKKL